ncbi:uncharacterized protein LOC121047094 [Ixodes scapularis]|uniref:uncharacterized protein LOC121047094 n=1 Tax=Ixodes scapularis TaxID=6945 RepID=UPI001C38DC3E|nr:uncharacterized protein LOC121047094 [Ixodes scapularis]
MHTSWLERKGCVHQGRRDNSAVPRLPRQRNCAYIDEDLDHNSSFGGAVTPVEMEVAHLLATFGHVNTKAHCGSLAREDEDLHSSSRALGYTEADMEAACVLATFNHAAKAQQTALSTNSYVDKAVEVYTGDFGRRFTDILSAENINTLTGLTSMELLETLTACADFYNISGCTVTKCTDVLVTLIPILGKVLSSVLVLPSKSETLMKVPTSFDKYQNVRLVLDCTEVPVAQPRCLKCELRMYSFYKKGFTCKYMVSVTPGGLIAHISAGYGGRASYKHIFEESGVVDLLLPVIDNVMVDRGFLIDQICEDRLIKVIRPPFKKQRKQMSRTDALDTQRIASARGYVERVIQRMKIFKILSTKVTWNMVPLLDDIMMIAAGLTNLSAPILAPERFL